MRASAWNRKPPGHRFNVDLGSRYDVGDRLGLLLQVNVLFKARDQGANAEPGDTGGKFVFVSPGLSYAFTRGVQLVARYAFAAGLNVRF